MKRIDFIKKTLCGSVAVALGVGLLESCESDELLPEISESNEVITLKSKKTPTKRSGHQTYMVIDNISYSTEGIGKNMVTFDLLIAYSLKNQNLVVNSNTAKTLDYVQTKDRPSSAKVNQRKVAMNGNIYDLKDYRENVKRVSLPVDYIWRLDSPINLISMNEFSKNFSEELIELI